MSSTLHDDAYDGTLKQADLDRHLAGAPVGSINSVGGRKKLTPLAAACLRGHVSVVKLLLDNGADPNALSSHHRPPLFYVTSRTTNNRLEILRALLASHADVDNRFPEDLNSTALMNALTETRDKALVHELVDNGASLDAQNSNGQSVRQLAKEVGMEQELLSGSERDATRCAIIDLIVAVVMFVITVVNSGVLKDSIIGAVSKIYEIQAASGNDKARMKDLTKAILGAGKVAQNFTSSLDREPEPSPNEASGNGTHPGSNVGQRPSELIESSAETSENAADTASVPVLDSIQGENSDILQPVSQTQRGTCEELPVSIDDFKDSLATYVQDTGLEKFFARDDPFIQNLAERAAALSQDKTTPLSKPENIKRLVTLSLYHPVIYCDDSGSMSLENRFTKQRHLVSRMARIATKLVPEGHGVELRFINTPVTGRNLDADALDNYFAKVQPRGGTRIGTVLRRDILKPLVYEKADLSTLTRPHLVCAITDGAPSGESPTSFKDAIVECRRKLVAAGYDPASVTFCISQIGNDEQAAGFLTKLRDDEEIQDVLYCTTERLDGQFEEMRANEGRLEEWLLKLMTRPIMERYEE